LKGGRAEGSKGAKEKLSVALRRCVFARDLNLEESKPYCTEGSKGAKGKLTAALRRCARKRKDKYSGSWQLVANDEQG
jgi:hypothetical protein